MAEFEELKINVSLSDNASAKLKEMNTQLGKIGTGGEANRKVSENFKQSIDFASTFGKGLRGIADAFNLFGNLPIFKLGPGAGFAGLLIALKGTNDALGAFAKEMLALRDMSRAAGLLPDQFKNMANQLKLVGYSSDGAAREVTSFVRTIDEAARPGTAAFQRIYSEAWKPEVAMARINQMRDLIRSGQPGRAITMAAQEARAIYERELRRPGGGGMQEARRQAEGWLTSIGLSMQALGITDISDFAGDPTKWQRRIEAAERFNREYEKFNKVLGGFVSEIKTELLPVFQDLNQALRESGAGFGSMMGIISSDIEDFRKILALLEGDYQKFASLLPMGPLRRAIMGNIGPPGEVQGPPTAFGEPPKLPQGAVLSSGQRDTLKLIQDNEAARESNTIGNALLEQIKRFSSNLFALGAAENAKPPDVQGNPAFHNAPQGGVEGESNPIQIPAGAAQPGGGAAAEARGSGSQRTQAAPQGSTTFSGRLSAAATANPVAALGAQRAGERVYTYGQLATGFPLPGVSEARADVAREGISETHGVSFPGGATPSAFVQTDPDLNPHVTTTLAHELGHVGRRQVAEAQTNIFKQYLYGTQPGEKRLGKGAEENIQRFQDVRNAEALYKAGVISPQEYRSSQEEAAAGKEEVSPAEAADIQRHLNLQEAEATRLMREMPGVDLPTLGGGTGGGMSGGRSDGVHGMAHQAIGRDTSLFDGALGADAGIDASAGLDVNVRGPKGVDVKASGDGMFQGNTSVSRQVDLGNG